VLSLYSGAGSLGNYVVREHLIPFRFMFSLCGFFSLLLARPAFIHGSGRERLDEPGVFVILLLISILGMHILTASNELITFFLGLEMATLPLYALTTWHRDKAAMEAGIKYLLIGSLSTALMLFGMSFIFGGTGSLHFDQIANSIAAS
jgi:NADH-quinone oxidoreductase subunit N